MSDGDDDKSRARLQSPGQGQQWLHHGEGDEESQQQTVSLWTKCAHEKGVNKNPIQIRILTFGQLNR